MKLYSVYDPEFKPYGRVVEGIEVVDEIAMVRTGFSDKPVVPQVMKKVTLVEDPA